MLDSVAAGWEYKIYREGIWNLQITLTPHVVETNGSLVLVTDVLLENIGKIVVRAHPQNRCIVSYWRVDVPSGPWTVIERKYDPNRPLAKHDLLEPYYISEPDPNNPSLAGDEEDYELEPGAKYHEVAMITADPGENILIKCQFYEKKHPNDPITEYAFFHVPERQRRN